MQLSLYLAVSAAIAPGVHAWWTGRALIARTDDPAFPEMLLARRQRGIQVVAVAMSLLIVFATAHALWTIPVLILAALAGGFPFRRALYHETWRLVDYVPYVTASVVGGAGFWLLLAFTPGLIIALANGWMPDRAIAGATALAALFAVLLMAWERAYPRVWLAAHRATPLDRPDLQPRLDAIIERAGIRLPAIFRYGATGSYAMNAVALPSTREPRVAFGDSLLEMLAPDEITAIFAHEVAHLEHYDARVLGRLRLMTYLLVLGAVVLPVVLVTRVPAYAGTIALAWPFLVFGILLRRLSTNQAHEADSDRRGAALVGDPDPMIRALTKLHHYSRVPRRWPYDVERSASHPSLARRIQALRAASAADATMTSAASMPVPALAEPTVLQSTEAGRFIVLDATRSYWFEGVSERALDQAPTLALLREHAASYRAVAHRDLAELRVGITGAGRALVARDRAGRKWSVPLRASDIATAQSALDPLDGQLATSTHGNWARTARLVAGVAAVALIGMADFGWTWILLVLTLALPSAWSLAALGTMTIGRAALIVAGYGDAWGSGSSWIIAVCATACGIWACGVAWKWATSDPQRRRRRSSLAIAATAGALLLIVTQGFTARGMRLAWTDGAASQAGRVTVSGIGYGVSLSPGGRWAAIQMIDSGANGRGFDDTRHELMEWHYVIADSGGAVRTTDALDLAFADDDHVLVIRAARTSNDSMVVSLETAARDSSIWRRTLPTLSDPAISIDRDSGRWTLFGNDAWRGDAVIVVGSVADDSVAITRRSDDEPGGLPIHARVDGTALVSKVDTRGSQWMVLSALGLLPMRWDVVHLDGGDRHSLGAFPGYPDCGRSVDHGALHCIVVTRTGRSLWRIGDGPALSGIGALPRDFDVWSDVEGGRLAGASRRTGAFAVLDIGTRSAVRLAGDAAAGHERFISGVATAAGSIAALYTSASGSEVRFYRVR